MKGMRQLNLINYSLLVTHVELALVAAISWAWAHNTHQIYNEDHQVLHHNQICNVITGNQEVDTWLRPLNNAVEYILWQLPIFWVFWIRRARGVNKSTRVSQMSIQESEITDESNSNSNHFTMSNGKTDVTSYHKKTNITQVWNVMASSSLKQGNPQLNVLSGPASLRSGTKTPSSKNGPSAGSQ